MLHRGACVALLSCGSFNPPTYMHMRMFGVCASHACACTQCASTELARDYLQRVYGVRVIEGIISPASDAYGKPGLATAEHRVHMLRLAVANNTWLRVDSYETEQPHWTRTVLTLRRTSSDTAKDEKRARMFGSAAPPWPKLATASDSSNQSTDTDVSVHSCPAVSDHVH
ncbi:unnamed protein product [Sphagnum balticum]